MAGKKIQGNSVECEGPDFSLHNSSPKMDATTNNPLHESPALSNFLTCQIIVEYNSTQQNEKSKRKKTTHNPIEGNDSGCSSSENTFSPKASFHALNMLSGHPMECFSIDAMTGQSCEEVGIPQGDHEEKEQNMINTTAEKHQGVPDVSCNHISVAASPERFVKEYVPEVLKIEHGINDNISNPGDKNIFENNTILMKKNADDPADYDLSDKDLCYKSCVMVNADCRRSSGCPSPQSPNKEPTIQDNDKDDSQKYSDGPLRVGLMDGETKPSTAQVTSHIRAAAEEIKLSTDNIDEQRLMATSSVVDIPVEHLKTDGRQLDHTEITRRDLCCAAEEIELNTDNIHEQKSMTNSSAADIHVEKLETDGRQLDHTEITRNDLCCAGDVSDLSLDTGRDGHLKISQFSLGKSVAVKPKKLLILDVNGLLADFVTFNATRTRYTQEPEPDFVLKGKRVYKRPYCEDFLQFCFDRFHVGVWSSRAKSNVDEAIRFLMGKSASNLLFCWNQSHCTSTEFTTVENVYKPLVFKELRKLWEKEEPGLPWEKGEYNESNTLLLDDSPYKALMNPMHSAIFPYSYRYYNTRDSELGPGGDLRVYLEGLAMAENVQKYVSENPFGQRPIREANLSWGYYRRAVASVQRKRKWLGPH